MAKKKVGITQPVDSKDGGAAHFWFCMAALVPILAVGLRMFTAMPYKPPLAKTDIYSGYRWARCDSNRRLCDREYNETTTARVPQYTVRRADCAQDTQHADVPIILYSKDPHEHFSDKRAVGSRWVYSRVARELDDLRAEGIDPVRLENLVVSLAQTSSGNVGESIALKRPDLEERYWEQMKAFVHKYPEPDTGDVQELFKGWYIQDPEVYPPAATMPSLPAYGDFKWRIEQHSTLTAERYMSSVFYAGGYPWRMVYYPESVYSPGHVSIFLTPAASQLNLPNWSRRVSYNIRIYGHDKPAMSIWANVSNSIFTAEKRDDESGFSQFTTRELLAMRGRGYLRNDVLEIRAIIRVDAVSNMAPPPPTKDTSTGDTGMMTAILQRFVHAPLAAWSVVLGGTATNSAPCKWCSWQGGPSLDHPLPFGLKLILAPDHSGVSLGHVYGDITWLQAALNTALDILLPCCLAILLCHAAALPLFICNRTVGPLCGNRWYELLCYLKNAQSNMNMVLVTEGCLGRLLQTSLLLQQLLSRAGLLGLLGGQLFTLSLRYLQARDLEHGRICEQASPRSNSSSNSSGTSIQSAESPLPSPLPALWWRMFGMTLLAESLTNFGALWNLVAPLGIGVALLQGNPPTDVVYFQMLPATLVDCLRHSGSVPSRVMRGPLVLALKGLAASMKGSKVWYAALVPTEDSLHATVCSALAFVCLASVLVPELRRDWKLAAPVLALAASGPAVGLAMAAVCAWVGTSELPPDETAWQWLRKRVAALPTSIVGGVACATWQCLCAPLFLCRMLAALRKPALKVAPTSDKKPSMAEGKGAKRGASTSPQRIKQKHSGHSRAAGSKAGKPKLPKDAKTIATPPSQGKAKPSQRACDATATVTITSKGSTTQHTKPATCSDEKHASPDRPPLLPLSSAPNVIREAAATDNAAPVVQPTGKPPAGCTTPAAPSGQAQQHETAPVPDIPVPVTPPASDALPLPVALLQPTIQPRPVSTLQLADRATIPANVQQEEVSRPPILQHAHIVSAATAAIPAMPILEAPAALISQLPMQQRSPEDLLLAVLTGGPRAAPLGQTRLGAPLARFGPTPGSLAAAANVPQRKRPVWDAGSWDNAGAGWGTITGWGMDEDAPAAEEDAMVCVMCWEKPRQTTLAPCGHRALCAPCTKLLLGQRAPPLCPICRCGVQSYIMREFNA